MMVDEVTPVERGGFGAQQLMDAFPPRWHHPHKELVFGISCPPGSTHTGTVRFSRWKAAAPPDRVDAASAAARIADLPGYYDYEPIAGTGERVEWHVNFADPHLFAAYGSAMFAQDEMQCAEHPALGALREALEAGGIEPRTVEGGWPTPVLVAGVERRCRVATEPNAAEGRARGLYGNAFMYAEPGVVVRATTRIDPPTITNLIAMAAPSPAFGSYTPEQIAYVLTTAFTGFGAAAAESAEIADGPCAVVVHTGFWGCGAFGGNRALMTALQALAAEMAGIDTIVFHTGDPSGAGSVEVARALLESDRLGPGPISLADLTSRLVEMDFAWGESDGN